MTGIKTPEIWLDPQIGWIRKGLDLLHHMVLPMGVLFLTHFGGYMLVMRSTMLETLREDYIVTARAKGLALADERARHLIREILEEREMAAELPGVGRGIW